MSKSHKIYFENGKEYTTWAEMEDNLHFTNEDKNEYTLGFMMNRNLNTCPNSNITGLLRRYIELCCNDSLFLSPHIFDYIITKIELYNDGISNTVLKLFRKMPREYLTASEQANLMVMSPEEELKYTLQKADRIGYEYLYRLPEFAIAATLDYIVKNGLIIKKCEMCGKYFVPLSRSDEKYCDFKGFNPKYIDKTCKEANVLLKQIARVKDDKRQLYAKRVYNLLRGNGFLETLKAFINENKLKKEMLKSGEISEDAYFQWLNEQYKKNSNTGKSLF